MNGIPTCKYIQNITFINYDGIEIAESKFLKRVVIE